VWKALIDHTALEADAELHDSAKYHQVGVDSGNGWQRQGNGGLWGTDWFGRAQAAVIYIFVNDFHEALYFIRGTDAQNPFLFGRYHYTMTFPQEALPPVDGDRGGFWSLTMYDQDYFMPATSPNGRHNIGTGESRRRRTDVRRGRVADAASVARTAHRPSGAGQLAPGAGRTVRADCARLRTDPAATRRHVQAAERAAAIRTPQ
jgi:Protein of unknown function (DUF1214)